MSEWLPIETAPKDGTWVLLWGEKWNAIADPPIAAGRYVRATVEIWEKVSPTRKELVSRDDSAWEHAGELSPTHWMPLPPPPTSQGETDNG